MHTHTNTEKTTSFMVVFCFVFAVGVAVLETTCSQDLVVGKKADLSAGNRAVGAAVASSRMSARPVPHPGKEGQVRSRIGWRAAGGWRLLLPVPEPSV